MALDNGGVELLSDSPRLYSRIRGMFHIDTENKSRYAGNSISHSPAVRREIGNMLGVMEVEAP